MPDSHVAQKINASLTDRAGRKLSPNRVKRRARVLTSTLDLLAERGYDAVTVDQLAAAGGVSKKTIYDIYGSKRALVAQAVALRLDELLDEIGELLEGDGLNRLLFSVEHICRSSLQRPELARTLAPILLESAAEFQLISFFERLHRDALRRMMQEGRIQPWVDIDFTAHAIMLDQLSVQNLWASGTIDDASYPCFARLGALRILAALAKASVRKDLVEAIRKLQSRLTYVFAPQGAEQGR
jgi:TetR/AcrR family transcriptional regulator, cholesterol catabolism regulator